MIQITLFSSTNIDMYMKQIRRFKCPYFAYVLGHTSAICDDILHGTSEDCYLSIGYENYHVYLQVLFFGPDMMRNWAWSPDMRKRIEGLKTLPKI